MKLNESVVIALAVVLIIWAAGGQKCGCKDHQL